MTSLSPNADIPQEKLQNYLLVLRSKDDKSQFLAQAGYVSDSWQRLVQDLREQILPLKATPTQKTQYGQKYVITGELKGPNGRALRVKTIWIVTSSSTRLVTLFPD